MKHYVVSDLHLSMGKVNGKLHPLEDFDSDAQFGKFLDIVSGNNGQLIINGDWVDFLQLEPLPFVGSRQNQEGIPLGWNASEALVRLETCLTTHTEHFRQIASYLKHGGSLIVMQGNHDPEWFFPGDENDFPLQRKLREHLRDLAASKLNIQFIENSTRLGTAHIEHGHQRCEPMNAFQNHPHIFHAEKSKPLGLSDLRVELLWGSRFVIEFFNRLETEYPFADNLKPMTRAVILGLKNGWLGGAAAAQLVSFMHGAGVPLADLAEILDTKKHSGKAMLEDIPDPYLRQILLERHERDEKFQEDLSGELQKINFKMVDADEIWWRSDFGLEEVVPDSGVVLNLIRPPREFREAKRLLEVEGVQSVIFGHTHQEFDGNAEDAKLKNYFNTGTWTPRFDLREKKNRLKLQNAEFPLDILRNRSAFALSLPYAEIDVGPDRTEVELKEV